jgi:hypothetical protein
MARRGFEMVDVMKGEHKDIITMDCEPSDVQVIFIETSWFNYNFISPRKELHPGLLTATKIIPI